ncbi:ester cyclase [Microvirga sp.]|uniref:ester cyclase n=1 Tax=Microvirga sp. TaxID=1873136 RepID=UPI00391D1DBE
MIAVVEQRDVPAAGQPVQELEQRPWPLRELNEADGTEYRGENLGGVVMDAAEAFPDMHRELYGFYVSGDVVVVELSLNATHKGPLRMPGGTIKATGKEIHTPCCDVWRLKDGKI